MSFPRYPNYKPTSHDSLEVPGHWDARPLAHCGQFLKGRGGSKADIADDGLPCVRYGDLYTTHDFFIHQSRTRISESVRHAYARIEYGDVLFAASGETFDDIGKSAVNLIRSEAYCGGDIVILRPIRGLDARFLAYAADCLSARHQKASMGRGTTVKHIYPDQLARVIVAIPHPEEQAAIVTFLDRETAKINALVAEQERLIVLLKEKRQAVISHVVMKGLKPHAPMKMATYDWLGAVPTHWTQCRLKTVSSFTTSGPRGWSERVGEAGDLFVQSGDLMDSMGIDFDNCRRVQIGTDVAAEAARTQLRDGDVLVCITGARTGNVAVCTCVPETSYINQHLCLIRPGPRVLPAFLGMVLTSGYGQSYFSRAQYGLKQGLSLDDIREIPILVPPLDEQLDIVHNVTDTVSALASLRAEAESAMGLLHERRAALISAAVTGQIDVRGRVSQEVA